jgi:predicted nucleic acid-binding protein
LIVAQMERAGQNTIISFDRDFDRISGISRVET